MGLYLFVFEYGYLTSDTVSIFKYSDRIFITSTFNRILSSMVRTIYI